MGLRRQRELATRLDAIEAEMSGLKGQLRGLLAKPEPMASAALKAKKKAAKKKDKAKE